MHESLLSQLDHWLWPFGHELMVLATKHPLASGLYRLLAVTAHGATVTRHFLVSDINGKLGNEREVVWQSLGFGEKGEGFVTG